MRKIFLAVGVSSLSLSSFYTVQAADAVRRFSPARATVSSIPTQVNRHVASNDWSGFYVGAGGKFMVNKDFDLKEDGSYGPLLFGGFNMQNGSLVYGAEADAGYSFGGDAAKDKPRIKGLFGSLRARVGFEVMEPVVVFATVGLSVDSENTLKDDSKNETLYPFGGVGGLGVDVMLYDGISGRLGYNFNYYKTDTETDPNKLNHSVYAGVSVKL